MKNQSALSFFSLRIRETGSQPTLKSGVTADLHACILSHLWLFHSVQYMLLVGYAYTAQNEIIINVTIWLLIGEQWYSLTLLMTRGQNRNNWTLNSQTFVLHDMQKPRTKVHYSPMSTCHHLCEYHRYTLAFS